MKTILVTGAYGFVGSFVTLELQKFARVIPCARKFHTSSDLIVDLTKPKGVTLPHVDVVVHLAARTQKKTCHEENQEQKAYEKQNVRGTKNLLSLLEANPPEYFLYVSTSDVYGTKQQYPIDETATPHPETAYAKSKYEAEKLVLSWCRIRSIPLAIARLGNIYGPGDDTYQKSVPIFIKEAIAGKPLTIVGDGSAKRTYLFVEDVARALALIVRKKPTGIFNIVDGHPVSVLTLASTINRLTGNHTGMIYQKIKHLGYPVILSDKKLQSIGFSPRSLEQGLVKTIAYYKKQPQTTLLFDLDGTLLNHWKRMYAPYLAYHKEHHLKPIPFSVYKTMKHNGLSEPAIAAKTIDAKRLAPYLAWKKSVIESDAHFSMDTLQPHVVDMLHEVSTIHQCIIVTIRRDREATKKQLDQLGILPSVKHVVTRKGKEKKVAEVKRCLKIFGLNPKQTVLIGDSEEDVEAATTNHIRSISIIHGLRGRPYLSHLPTTIINSLKDLTKIL